MPAENPIIRGAPRYIRGPAAGGRHVIALVPEARVAGAGQTLRPLAVIELRPEGVRRHSIPAPGAGLLPLGLAGLLVPIAAVLLDRLWHHGMCHPRS